MKVAAQQEDLQLLARTLQEQLLAALPSGEGFQVKCAVNNGELMILTQHSPYVTVDTETIFQLLEEAFQLLPSYWEQPVQCFLRVAGEKRPYAQRSLTLHQTAAREGDTFGSFDDVPISFPSPDQPISGNPSIDDSDSQPELAAEAAFDPLAGGSDLLTSKSSRPIKPILMGLALVGIALSGGGAYLLTRPCVMSECPEMQTAEQVRTDSRQQIRRAKSEKELILVQQQLEIASSSLTKIPSWSPRYREGEALKASLSEQSVKINNVVKAVQAASLAVQKMQTPAKSLQELQARQNLWRQAIAPLEAINSQSDLYSFVQPRLLNYRARLININKQLLTEEKWLKKLNAAQAVASVATQQEITAKSLNEWQKVQSTWQVVINALNVVPRSSSGYQQAQELLTEYKPKLAAARDRATQEQLAAKTYQQAVGTANQAKAAEQNNQWTVAVVRWGQALEAAKQVSRNSSYYTQTQSLIEPYSVALKQAQEKLQITSSVQRTQADLKKTCTNQIQICTFTVESRGITVQLTPEYDQVRETSLLEPDAPKNPNDPISINNHWQNLQEALAIISDNANLPLLVFNSQGKAVYTRTMER
ncbi:MAG: hypothetical protein KME23_19840 [Goleter apudmare HA4340-LM2]|nr:hypothetical protein [Goleter apudmare HA4340-LM2]